MSDARWIALQYRGAILALAEEYRNHTLRELVDACRIRVVERFVTESDFALSELSAIEYPSATLALVRITDDRVDTALFSDTTMALRIGDRVVIPTDERLKRYDESALRAFREALAR